MEEEVQMYLEETEDKMQSSISHLEMQLAKIRAGKANPSMLDSITVDYYGTETPLAQVANVNTPDPKTILIQPWEKNLLGVIDKAILAANIGLTPMNNGEVIHISIPPLTEERRIQLVKQAKIEGEDTKVGIRNTRKWANDEFKQLQKEGLSEDNQKDAELEGQRLTDDYSKKVEELIELKEKDILTI